MYVSYTYLSKVSLQLLVQCIARHGQSQDSSMLFAILGVRMVYWLSSWIRHRLSSMLVSLGLSGSNIANSNMDALIWPDNHQVHCDSCTPVVADIKALCYNKAVTAVL